MLNLEEETEARLINFPEVTKQHSQNLNSGLGSSQLHFNTSRTGVLSLTPPTQLQIP